MKVKNENLKKKFVQTISSIVLCYSYITLIKDSHLKFTVNKKMHFTEETETDKSKAWLCVSESEREGGG